MSVKQQFGKSSKIRHVDVSRFHNTDVGTRNTDVHDAESNSTPSGHFPGATTDNSAKIAAVTRDNPDIQTKLSSCFSFLQSLSLMGLVGSGSKVTKGEYIMPSRSYQDAPEGELGWQHRGLGLGPADQKVSIKGVYAHFW